VDDESQLGDLADYGSEMPDLDDEHREAPDQGWDDEPVFRFEVPDIGDDKSQMPDLDDEDDCEAPDIGSYDEFKEFVRASGSGHVGMLGRLTGLASRVRRKARAE
jgi:hypothetical protein